MNILRDIENLIINLVKSRDIKAISILTKSIPNIGSLRVEEDIPLTHYLVDFNDGLFESRKVESFEPDCLALLLNNGGNVVDDSNYGSFFNRAIRSKNIKLISWLLENDYVQGDDAIANNGATGLHIAAIDAVPKIFQLLLEYTSNADIEASEYTPLAYLMLHSSNPNLRELQLITSMLIKRGAMVNPIVESIYIDKKIPLSYELKFSIGRRGDGQDYESRAEMIEALDTASHTFPHSFDELNKLALKTKLKPIEFSS